jgi:hypothetical protein
LRAARVTRCRAGIKCPGPTRPFFLRSRAHPLSSSPIETHGPVLKHYPTPWARWPVCFCRNADPLNGHGQQAYRWSWRVRAFCAAAQPFSTDVSSSFIMPSSGRFQVTTPNFVVVSPRHTCTCTCLNMSGRMHLVLTIIAARRCYPAQRACHKN